MKDLFEGKEYEVITPKEGDIVRINLHRTYSMTTKRGYFLLVWPSNDCIHSSTFQNSKIIYCHSINLGGEFGYHGLCCVPPNDKIVRPSIGDVFEFIDKLRINGYIYNRRTKEIIKIKL